MFPEDLVAKAAGVLDRARAAGVMIATAESCTGGLVAGALTAVAGSSDVLDRGFVTYSNEAKVDVLGVDAGLIAAEGAVSEAVARAMAEGAVARSRAGIVVAVTGIAGPGGGTVDKPVGMVWFATAVRGGETVSVAERFGDLGRDEVRAASVERALGLLLERL
jgi:nicotinamide-nucleotide amidase